MKRFSQQFKKRSESIHLKASEKSALRARIVSYMEYHPLPQEMRQAELDRETKKEFIIAEPFRVITFNKLYVRSFAGLFAVILMVGVPFFAEHALPGDVLYPMKIQFNEQLRSTLAITPYAKVAWETQTLERRISEARLLASEGKLTQETETQVAQAVKTHSDAAQREIDTLRQSDSDGAALAEITLASALAVQSEVLAGHTEKDTQNSGPIVDGDGRSIAALAQVVNQARDSAQAAQIASFPSYEKLLARVESESTRTYELFSSVKKEASAEEISNIERRFADIQRKVDVAIQYSTSTATSTDEDVMTNIADLSTSTPTSTDDVDSDLEATSTTVMDATSSVASSTETQATSTESEPVVVAQVTSEKDAIELLRSALTDIQKLQNYLTNIDVRNNVSINDLVPITLTADERITQINDLFEKIDSLITQVDSKIQSSDIQAKVTFGENLIQGKIDKATKAMKKTDLDTAYVSAQDAYLLALDLDALTEKLPSKKTSVASTTPKTDSATDVSTSTDKIE